MLTADQLKQLKIAAEKTRLLIQFSNSSSGDERLDQMKDAIIQARLQA